MGNQEKYGDKDGMVGEMGLSAFGCVPPTDHYSSDAAFDLSVEAARPKYGSLQGGGIGCGRSTYYN